MMSAATMPTMTRHVMFRALLPFACGYFMSYLFRAVNSVIAPDLMAELGLTRPISGC